MDAVYWHDGQWTTDNPKLLGPADHAFWMASMVFDGARVPRPHARPGPALPARGALGRKMLMKPQLGWEAIQDLCLQAVAKFPEGTELYIKPMFYCADGFLLPDADRTQFVLHVFKVPMPGEQGFSAFLQLRALLVQHGAHRRQGILPVRTASAPSATRPTVASTTPSCWTATATSPSSPPATWIAKNGVVSTPVDNGTFLNGITRRRVLALLKPTASKCRSAA